jgi:hypothetical protein
MKRLSWLGLFALAACADVLAPPGLCACSPQEPAALLAGVLTDTVGQAVPGARVQFVARDAQDTLRRVSRSTLTDSAGAFRLYAGGPTEDSTWVHIFVHDTTTGVVTRPAPDSVRVRFRFGAAIDSTWISLRHAP